MIAEKTILTLKLINSAGRKSKKFEAQLSNLEEKLESAGNCVTYSVLTKLRVIQNESLNLVKYICEMINLIISNKREKPRTSKEVEDFLKDNNLLIKIRSAKIEDVEEENVMILNKMLYAIRSHPSIRLDGCYEIIEWVSCFEKAAVAYRELEKAALKRCENLQTSSTNDENGGSFNAVHDTKNIDLKQKQIMKDQPDNIYDLIRDKRVNKKLEDEKSANQNINDNKRSKRNLKSSEESEMIKSKTIQNNFGSIEIELDQNSNDDYERPITNFQVQSIQKEMEQLKKKNISLELENASLRAKMEDMKRMFDSLMSKISGQVTKF